MQDTTFNGYTNYETYIVARFLDGNKTMLRVVRQRIDSFGQPGNPDTAEPITLAIADLVREFVVERIPDCGATLHADLIGAALGDVNWRELALEKIGEVAAPVEAAADPTEVETAEDLAEAAETMADQAEAAERPVPEPAAGHRTNQDG
jgi:hypothetical protein